jgi:hypothetical protein
MQTQYVPLGQTVQFGELRPALLLGTGGPSSYSQTTRDPVSNPAAGDYIAVPFFAVTLSLTYEVQFYPLAVNDVTAGAPSASQSGWVAQWFVNATGAEAANGTNLSAEKLQFGAFITQL